MKLVLLLLPFVLLYSADGKRDGQKQNRNRHSGRRALDEDDDKQNSNSGQCELEIRCKGETSGSSTPVRLPIKGPRGPSGRPGEKGAQGEPGKQGPQGVPGKSADIINHVAFYVGLGENVGPVTVDTVVVFDKVITNVGGAYDQESGKFTAPFSGTFLFSLVVAARDRQKAAVNIVRNGTMIATVWAESIPSWATSSKTAILNLASGEQVWLVLLRRAPYLHGYMYTAFSGYSLFGQSESVTNTTTNSYKESVYQDEVVVTTSANVDQG